MTARLPLLEGDFLLVDYQHRHLARYAWRLDERGLAYRLGWNEAGQHFTIRHLHEDVLGIHDVDRLEHMNGDAFDYRAANLVPHGPAGRKVTHSRTVPPSVHPTGERRRVRVNP